MSRLTRVAPVGIPQHIIQRGNNKQVCFGSDDDMAAYMNWLIIYSREFQVDVHAWVLMPNHVHLLATPYSEKGISKMLQSLGRCYVRFFNDTYDRSGTLWEGRFRAGLVQSELYMLELYRYIELNPVRAAMVNDPSEYKWSSYPCNAQGKDSDLLTPHACYLALGKNAKARQKSYRAFFDATAEDGLLDDIRHCVNAGLAIGDARFKDEIEQQTGERVSARKRGRPKIDKPFI
jgi:putative transposase